MSAPSTRLPPPLRDAIVCLSVANLLYLRAWGFVLNPANRFYFTSGLHWSYFLSPFFGVAFVAAGLFAMRRLLIRAPMGSVVAHWGFFAVLLLIGNTIRNEIPSLSFHHLTTLMGRAGALFGVCLAGGGLLWAFHNRSQAVAKLLSRVLIALFPFLLLTGTRAIVNALEAAREVRRASRPLVQAPGPRLVLLMLDGMDGETAEKMQLPALGRLEAEAIVFADAAPPSGRRTLLSVPSYTLGRTVADAKPSGPNDLLLRFEGANGYRPWSGEATLFRIARQEGVNISLVGWALPYCRVFGSQLAECNWWPYLLSADSLRDALLRDAQLVAYSIPGLYRVTRWLGRTHEWTPDLNSWNSWHLDVYRDLHSAAIRAVTDERFRLVFLHYSIPHEPFILDESGRFSAGAGSYAGNMRLADRALGELRRALEDAGLWQTTGLIVVSDHAPKDYPSGYRRVPFVVKLPNAAEPLRVDRRVETLSVFDLALGILRGQITTADAVVNAIR